MVNLDLHRTKHEDARRKVIHFIEDNWYTVDRAEIITGRSHQMRAIVIDVLKEYGLEYRIGDPSGFNAGYLTVYWR